MKFRTACAAFALLCPACFGGFAPAAQPASMAEAQAQANQQVDAVMAQRIEKARAAAQQGGAREATVLASELRNAYLSGAVERGSIDGPKLLEESRRLLERAAEQSPEEAPALRAVEGNLLLAAGRDEEGVAALRASMDARPSLAALLPLANWLDENGRRDEIVPLCKRTLETVDTDDERYEVLYAAVLHTHAASVDGGLAWASADDRAFFKEEKARRDEQAARENAAHRQREEEKRQRMMADFEESRKRSEEKDRCKSRCEADKSSCDSQCGTNASCNSRCYEARSHCFRSCS